MRILIRVVLCSLFALELPIVAAATEIPTAWLYTYTGSPFAVVSGIYEPGDRIYAFGFTYVTFKLVNAIVPLRVPAETELEGLDIPEFGMTAYPEDALAEAK